MSLRVYGNIKIVTPAKVTYRGTKWTKVTFKAEAEDPHDDKTPVHKYFCEMFIPKEQEKTVIDTLIPGTYCSILAGRWISPTDMNINKVSIHYSHFEILG